MSNDRIEAGIRHHAYTRKQLLEDSPQVGMIVAFGNKGEHPRPWRVMDVRTREHPAHPEMMIPVCALRPLDKNLDMEAGATDDDIARYLGNPWTELPEHYPVCRICQQLMPCEHVLLEKQFREDMRHMDRYQTPGICPACQEPVTQRQHSRTFTYNLYVPGGPPVTFHTRKKCSQDYYHGYRHHTLLHYEQRINRLKEDHQ